MTATAIQERKRFGGRLRAIQQQVGRIVQFEYHRASEGSDRAGIVHTGPEGQYAGKVLRVWKAGNGNWLALIACLNRVDLKTGKPQVRAFIVERIDLHSVQHARETGELAPVFKAG